MKCFAVFCLGILMSDAAIAAGCDWATDTPADDANYKYFVARVYSDISASDAQAKAEQEINSQICRLFGAEVATSNEYYSDTTSAIGTSRTNERCVGIRLEKFSKEKTGDERAGREFISCVKYKYAKSAYRTESARIHRTSTDITTAFNETMGDASCVGAPLQITTSPSGVEIYIDGQYKGDTPLKIGNICRGNYKLKFKHDNYEIAEQRLIIPTATGKIFKTLTRATKKIKITADDTRAQITVNGRNIGRTPATYIAKLGETIEVQASADGTETAIRQVEINKYSDDKIKLNLQQKLVKLDFSGWRRQNPGWRISVDGHEIDTITKIEPNESHRLHFSKDGFRSVNDNYSHAPTDKVVYFDHSYNFVPTKSMARTSGVNIDLLSGIGATSISADTGNGAKTGIGATFDMLALRLRANAFYARFSGGYDWAKASNNNIDITTGLRGDINLGVNVGDSISVFGIAGGGMLDIERPKINENDFSGNAWHWFHGLGLEYNLKDLPFSIRLTYITASVDLWNDFYIGNKNTPIRKLGLSFQMNWSAAKRLAQ